MIEKLLDQCCQFEYSGDIEADEQLIYSDYKLFKNFINQKSHYFISSNG